MTLNHETSRRESTVSDFISLLKPRVMSLVIFTAISGLLIAPGHIHPFIAFISILCTALGSGAAGCLNMWYDRDIDAIMIRTKNRAIVRGSILEADALTFGLFLSVISVVGMIVCVNLISGITLAISIGFYVGIYTIWLKRSTEQNIVIGGAAGAFPPIIGWASVTNSVSLDAIILFLIIFFWTPPHFWALALYKSDDYRRANIPMMPVVRGEAYTKDQMLLYSIIMCLCTIAPYFTSLVGEFYLVISTILNLFFMYLAVKLRREKGHKTAPKLFGFSIIYLFAIFALMIADHSLSS